MALPFTSGLLPPDRIGLAHPVSVLVVALQLLSLYFLGLYVSSEPRPRLQVLGRLGAAALLQGLTLVAYLFLADRTFPRSVLLLYLLLDWATLAVWRLAVQGAFRPPRRRVALIGASPAARELAGKIRGVQDRYKLLAVLLPPIPPILLAFFVFFHRRKAEREGVTASRLRYGKVPTEAAATRTHA